MKKLVRFFVLTAIAAFTLVACSKNEDVQTPEENEFVTLKFNVRNTDNGALTKALLGTNNGKSFLDWEDGDKIGTFSVGSFVSGQNTSNESKNNPGTVGVSGNDYTLNVQTFNGGTVTNIYSYFPYSASAGKEKTSATVTIPFSQHMTNVGFDADAMPMAGEPIQVNLTTIANTDEPCGTINFSNLGSIIKFRVYTSVATSETLKSVTYKATGIGGAFSIDLTQVDASDETTLALTAAETASEITTSFATPLAIGTGLDNAIDVYMVVAPGSYTGSQVVVTTNAHTYTLNASGEKTFSRSHIKPLKVDISKGTVGDLPATETWTKVTVASEFTEGTYYILRADGAYYVPNGTGNPACVSYTAGDDITTAMKWTATASGTGLVFESVANPEYYLWTTNTGNANSISVAKTSTGANASKVWTFASVEANSTTYYTATAGADKYLTSYGTSNWRYYGTSNINESNIPAEFYKLKDNRQDPGLAFSSESANATLGESFTAPTLTKPQNITVDYSSSNTDIATVDASGVITLVAAGTTTITARFKGNDTYKAGSASYTLNVIDPNANDGSEEKPFTPSEAAAAASGGNTSEVYVKGIISSIVTAYNSQYGNVSFNISEDGLTTSDQFEIFRAEATSEESFKVGDIVMFKGNLTVHNTTPELDQGNELISQIKAPRFSPAGGNFTTTQSVSLSSSSGATIRYTTDGSTPTSTTGTIYNGAISISQTTTIKAIAIVNNEVTGVSSATFTISSAGTENDPFTPSEAAAAALGGSTSEVYVKGIISSIVTAYNSQYGNVSFNISEDGLTTSDQFEIFRAEATSEESFKVGDIVKFKGNLTLYNTTPELAQGNELVSQIKAPRFSPDGGNFTSSQTITLSSNSGATIRYTTDGSTPTATTGTVYNSAISISQTTTIKAIAIVDNEVTGVSTETFTKVSSSAVTETLTVGTNGNTTWDNGKKTQSATVGDVTFTALGSGGNDGKYYSSDQSWRFYTASSSGVKITVPSGKKITKIVITWKTGQPVTPSGFTASGTTSPTTYTPNEGTSVNEVSFVRNSSANFLAQVISVTYE